MDPKYSDAHDNGSGKPKRQRRSYACGPCKLLKIKCDLQTPCTSCIKFKRAEKCMADPPQPPSAEEQSKTMERKKKTLSKRHTTPVSSPPAPIPSIKPAPRIPSTAITISAPSASSASSAPSAPSVLSAPSPASASTSVVRHQPQPHPHTTVKLEPIHIGHFPVSPLQLPPLSNLLRQVPPTNSPTPPNHNNNNNNNSSSSSSSNNNNTNNNNNILPSLSQFEDNSHLAPAIQLNHTPPIPIYHPQHNIQPLPQFQINYSQAFPYQSINSPSPLPQVPNIPKSYIPQPQLSQPVHLPPQIQSQPPPQFDTRYEYYQDQQTPPIFSSNLAVIPHSIPSAIPSTSPETPYQPTHPSLPVLCFVADDQFYLSPADKLTLFQNLPLKISEAENLISVAWNAEHPHLLKRSDYDPHFQQYLKYLNNYKDDGLGLTLSVETIKSLSYILIVFAIGELFSDLSDRRDISQSRISMAIFIRLKLLKLDSVEDINYLIEFYLFLRNYYFLLERNQESYVEFNQLLSYILLNDKFLEAISERESLSPLKESLRFWIRLRSVQVEHPYFEARGTLLSTFQLKDLILPHKDVILHVFDDEALNTGVFGFISKMWSVYFKRTDLSLLLKDIIRSYLQLYCDTYQLTKDDLKKLEEIQHNNKLPNFEDALYLLSYESLFLLVKNSIILSLFIRWLSFVRIESTYFPLLRYTSYFTSVISLFNHMKFLANVCEPHGINIIDKLYQEFGACPFNYILSSIVSLLIIQVVLANFLSLPSVNSSVNLQEIFGKVHADSKFMVNIIGNSRAYKTKLSKVECYSNALAAGERGIEIAARLMDSNSNQETLRELVGYYESGMGDFLTEYIFIKQFGSADGFARYVEKVWEFFIYLTLERQVTVGQQGEETGASDEDKILITRNIELNDDLINKWKEKFCGFEISRDIIDEYMIYVAGPHLQL